MPIQPGTSTTSDMVNITIPADVAAVIVAAATTAVARGDSVPTNVAVVIAATVKAAIPNARAITITKRQRQERTRRVHYRRKPVEPAWHTQGRVAIMTSHMPRH